MVFIKLIARCVIDAVKRVVMEVFRVFGRDDPELCQVLKHLNMRHVYLPSS